MRALIIIALVLMPGISVAAEWFEPFTGEDWAYQAVYTGITVIDWRQTQTFTKDPDKHENNPFLGRDPSREKIDTYIGGAILLHGLVAYALPKKYRRHWQMFWIGVEAGAVHHNYKWGVRISF